MEVTVGVVEFVSTAGQKCIKKLKEANELGLLTLFSVILAE